jgi:capsular exopolysaccharide synthesis family protein
MAKTYEALRKAESDYHIKIVSNVRDPISELTPPPQNFAKKLGALDYYESLRTNLMARYPEENLKVILFNGTDHGNGASTTSINFATLLAKEYKRKVLLIEVNLRTPSFQQVFKMNDSYGLAEAMEDSCKLEPAIQKVGPGELYALMCGGRMLNGMIGVVDSPEFDQFLVSMRERFDFVIFDSPPVPIFSEFRILCRKVDGVVLVLNAMKTRRQAALRAKLELEDAGAKLLGVIINKRKYYIPKWLYRKL